MLGYLYQWPKVRLACNAVEDIQTGLGTDHRGNADSHFPATAQQWPLSPLEEKTIECSEKAATTVLHSTKIQLYAHKAEEAAVIAVESHTRPFATELSCSSWPTRNHIGRLTLYLWVLKQLKRGTGNILGRSVRVIIST